MRNFLCILIISTGIIPSTLYAQTASWYQATIDNKASIRWWWHGSAVDSASLAWNLEQFASAGIGAVEITPIYGVSGNEEADIPFLSPHWMELYGFTYEKAQSLGMQVDMNGGTGWPFGGPQVTAQMAAKKMERKGNTICSVQTGQKVKRAAPGGEGFVLNHYDSLSLLKYLQSIETAFEHSGACFPNSWFSDSFEVYGSDWTDKLPEVFESRYGYDIIEALLNFTGEKRTRAICDYRECLGEILAENFHKPLCRWAHSHGSSFRNQSHGSPANILDLYSIVDIPEAETYGRSDFNIPGLRQDNLTRHNDGDPAALKFASSAAHLTGKKYASCETLTWLTEHFRTSLSQCKPEIDKVFCSGINHIVLHGAAYSPIDVEFPGWMFYASVNMSPTSSIWKDAPALFKYIERCQAFLSAGEADPDFLLYVPIYDIWSKDIGQEFMMFDIHSMDRTMPELKKTMNDILNAGFDADYISDKLLSEAVVNKPVIVPNCHYIKPETAAKLVELKSKGIPVHFIGRMPDDVPGLSNLDERRIKLKNIIRQLGKAESLDHILSGYKPEGFVMSGGSIIRRRNEAGGWNYFFSMLTDNNIDGWIKLAINAASAVIYDPLDERMGRAEIKTDKSGNTLLRLQLDPGQSLLVKTFPEENDCTQAWKYIESYGKPLALNNPWNICFKESIPEIKGEFTISKPQSWTELDIPGAKINAGTAIYSTTFEITESALNADGLILDLGDVRESARVYINGKFVTTLFCVPFRTEISKWLKDGSNVIEIHVTNMDSNRISEMERQGVKWRIFKDANISSITGNREFSFADWPVDCAGLISEVTLTPVFYKNY